MSSLPYIEKKENNIMRVQTFMMYCALSWLIDVKSTRLLYYLCFLIEFELHPYM